MLYIVPTPVGNLSDMTPRSIEVLRNCNAIYAEDTRTSGVLMKYFGITTPLLSFHKFNEHEALEAVMQRLDSGEDIALISDAGTPGISDPGFLLSRECRRRDLEVITLPGATAFVPALVNSGLPCDRFVFEGFLPPKKGRTTRIEDIASRNLTSIIYESPLRLVKTLQQLSASCGKDRPASVTREISKMHEETKRGTLQELEDYFAVNPPRGEIVITVAGKETPARACGHRNKFKQDSEPTETEGDN